MRQPIDWPSVYAEALDIFVRYLRIPSVNPPGNEAPAARFPGSLIEAAGVACEYIPGTPAPSGDITPGPGRSSVRPV